MHKIYSLLLTAALFCVHANAQTVLLDEGFETGSTTTVTTRVAAGDGWTTVNGYSGSNAKYNWHNYYSKSTGTDGSGYANQPTITGDCVACVDGDSGEGKGPREEILLTPELDLNDNYQLSFTWRVSPMNQYDYSRYDLQVRIVTDDNLASAETIFSIQDLNMLRESGVLSAPTTWDPHTSKIDLSDWKGEKVKIAFVYKMFTNNGNVVWLDDVLVKSFTPSTGPVASISLDRYNFGDLYVGEKFYTEVITLTNTGKDILKVTGFDLPQGVTCTLNTEEVNLAKYESVKFQLAYTATMTSPASATATIHTNGGDVSIALTANKQVIPEGFLLETFEQFFPPAGWRNNGWDGSSTAMEGDRSAYCSGGYGACYLTSPRLDLSEGGKVTFSYVNAFDDEDVPYNDIELQVSYDGGDTWTTKWTAPYDFSSLNTVLTPTVDLGEGTDNSYIRWYYTAITTSDEGADPHSNFLLDRVLLPNVYGAEGAPKAATIISPKLNEKDVYPRDIVLKWGPAQFADGYRVFVGTNPETNDLVDGVDVGNELTYTIPVAAYETTYRWKIVPYNAVGSAQDVTTWRFTTQKDASVSEYPYVEDFASKDIPTGWTVTPAQNTYNFKWSVNTMFPYEKDGVKSNAMASSWLNAGDHNIITTPEFKIPTDKTLGISFVWGDEHPRDLVVDETGLIKKKNVEPNNGVSDCVFEIFADGKWTALSHISENSFDGEHKYWITENIDLSAYAGKVVQFRWIHYSFSGADNGSAIAHIVIEEVAGDKAEFNKTSWMAGKVNYNKAINSGDVFTLLNKGVNALKVKSATFKTDYFTTSLAAGDEIPVDGGKVFNLQFNAGSVANVVDDELTIEFESGYKVTFPVQGEGLASDVLYYSFEPNPLDYVWRDDFTMIDVDNKATYELNYYQTIIENDGQKYAFTSVENNNTSMLAALSGNHTIAAAAPADNSAANDWLISKKLRPAEGATFDFYARNLGTVNSVFIGDNDYHSVGVYVSEGGNSSTKEFTAVMRDTEMPYLKENEWNHYVVDLSQFAGKDIYVAVHHTTVNANWFAFFDDFTFNHVQDATTGIQNISTEISSGAQVEIFTANGVKVTEGKGVGVIRSLGKGLYIVKVKDGNEVKTLRITRK